MPKRELRVTEHFDWIERGLEYRRHFGQERSWAKLEALFYNVHPSQDKSSPNIVMATGDALLSQLVVPNPYLTIQARRGSFVERVRILERVDNSLIKELNFPDEVELSILHAYLWGVGIIKFGFDSEFGYDPEHEIIPDAGMTLTQYNQKGEKIEYGRAKPGMPWAKAVLPHDIVVPWGTPRDINEAPKVAHRVVRHIDDVKADPKYTGKRGLRPMMSMKDFMKSYDKVLKPYRSGEVLSSNVNITGKPEYVELWEIHDQRTGKIQVIATGHDKFLRNDVDLIQLGGLPFESISFVPRARSFWVTSDADYLLSSQAELTDIAIQSSKHRRLSILKFLYGRDAISPEALERLTSSDVGAGVPVEGGFNPNEAVTMFQPPPNLQLGVEKEAVRRDARELVGFSRNQVGEFEQTGRRTASEALIVDRSSQNRMSRRQMRVRDLYVNSFRKINPLIFSYWRSPRIQLILDETGIPVFRSFTGSDLKGDFDYEVSFTQDPPASPQQRKQEAIQFYLAMIQDPAVDPIALRRYLAGAFNDVEFSSIFRPGVLSGDANIPLRVPSVQQQGSGDANNEGGGRAPDVSGVPVGLPGA